MYLLEKIWQPCPNIQQYIQEVTFKYLTVGDFKIWEEND